jgi:hypothetical protein
MFQFIPKGERRFWRIFRCLLMPISLFSTLLSTGAAIASACGEKAVFVNGQVILGWRGALVAYLFLLWMIPGFTFIAASAVYWDRRISPSLRERFSRLLFWRRR